jgi:outer membrane protein assembly factor BamB
VPALVSIRRIRLAGLLALPSLALFAADWPQLLGPERNGVAPGPVSLKAAKLAWKKDVGAGFSGPVVAGGKLILHQRNGDLETVDCMNAATGQRIWKYDYRTEYRDDFGFDEGPRGTPAIAEGRVYTFGAEGALHAFDLNTGNRLWRVDTHSRFKVQQQFFGDASSPLVGDAVYLNVGGSGGVAAFDKKTGDHLWSATTDEAGYSSPVFATIGNQRVILSFTRAGLVGIDTAGKILFKFSWRSRSHASVNAALPVVAGNLVFLSASYNTGATVLELGGAQPKQLWSSDEALSNHYATSVLKDGFLYGFHGRQEFGQSLRCIEMKTGKVRWNVDGFGAGTVTLAGDRLLVLRENGEAIVAPATPEAFRPESKAELLPAVVRSYPALADGRLFLRNEKTLAAYTLQESK